MIKAILKDSSFFLFSTIVSKFSMFLITIMVSRYLGKEAFGQFSLIRGMISILEIYVAMGTNHTTTKAIAGERNNKYMNTINNSLFVVFINMLIVSFIMFLFTGNIADFFFKTNDLDFIFALKISLVLLFFTSLANVLTSILAGLEAYRLLAKSSLYSAFLFLPLAIYLIKSLELIGSIYAVSLFFIIQSLIMLFYTKQVLSSFKFRFLFNKFSLKKKWDMIKFSFPLFISLALVGPIFWYGKTLLISSSENSFAQVAFFEAAYQWLTIIIVITGAVSNISLSKFSKLFSTKNIDDLRKTLKLNIFINLLISIFFTIVISLFAQDVMSIYGSGYQAQSNVMIILLLASIPMTANGILMRFFVSINKNFYNLYGSLLWASIFIGCLIYLSHVDMINAFNFALVFNISYIGLFIFSIIMAKYYLKIQVAK